MRYLIIFFFLIRHYIHAKKTLELYDFRDLYNSDETKQVALDTFKKNKPSYMDVAVRGLEIDMKLVEKMEH